MPGYDGLEALRHARAVAPEIRAVVTDLDMPHLDGPALARMVRALNPSVRLTLGCIPGPATPIRLCMAS